MPKGSTLKIPLLLVLLASVESAVPPVIQRHDLFYVPNAENVEAFIAENPFVVIFFYNGGLDSHVSLQQGVKRVSDFFLLSIQPSPVRFAEIDLALHDDAAIKLGVKSGPLLRLFHHGRQVPFREKFKVMTVVRWIRKYSEQKAIYIEENDNKYHHEDDVNCVLLRPNITAAEIELLDEMAKTHHDVIFYYTDLPKFLDPDADADHFRVVVRRRADHHAQTLHGTGPLKKEALEKFLARAKLPDSIPFGPFESNRFFHKKPTTCFYFFNENDDPKLKIFKKVGHKFKTQLEFSHVNMTEPVGQRLAGLMGVKLSRPGVVKLATFQGEEEFKYRLKVWETREELERFIGQFFAGELQPYMKSEPIPSSNPGPVHKLVAKNVQSLVFDNPADVLVFATFNLDPSHNEFILINQVADYLEHAPHINLTFANFNAALNQHNGLKLKDYPVWALFPRDRKHHPCLIKDLSTVSQIIRFVEHCLRRKVRYQGEEAPLNLDESL